MKEKPFENPESFKVALTDARSELDRLVLQRELIDARIATLRQTVGLLAKVCGEDSGSNNADSWKLIDACREIQRAAPAGEFQTADEIKAGLERLGYDTSGNTNIEASIHTTMRRLVENGDAELGTKGSKKAYRLKSRPGVRHSDLLEPTMYLSINEALRSQGQTITNAMKPLVAQIETLKRSTEMVGFQNAASQASQAINAIVNSIKQQSIMMNSQMGAQLSKIAQQQSEVIARALGATQTAPRLIEKESKED